MSVSHTSYHIALLLAIIQKLKDISGWVYDKYKTTLVCWYNPKYITRFTGYSAYGLVLSGSTRKYNFNHYSIHKYHKNKIMMLQAILAEESNCCLTLRQYLIHFIINLIRLFYQENVLHSSRHIAQMVHNYKWVGTGFGCMTIKRYG